MKTPLSSRWVAVLVLAVPMPAMADEIIVPTDMPLSVALATAQSGDIITILPTGSPYQQFPGFAFSNKLLTVRGSTGNPADVVLDGADLDIVLRISGAGAAGSIIQDLTIANGRGGAGTDATGAGVHLSVGANITLRHCVIRDNVVPGSNGMGAGIYGNASSVRIEDCLFENNTVVLSNGDGGATFLDGGNHVILDTVFRANGVAPGTAFANGSFGGGVYARGGSAQITRCDFQGNRSFFGGGICASGNETVTIDGCVFADNAANNGGGFSIDNVAGGAAPRIRNSLFVGNAGVNDAAIVTGKGGLFTNLTFVANTASVDYIIGGGVPATIDNCIFWDNTYRATNLFPPGAASHLVRRCILQQAYTGAAGSGFNQVVDPLFIDALVRDYHLSALSPAIDAGDSNLYFGPFSDLDGSNRGVQVPGTPDTGYSISGPVIDIGAFEFQVEPPPPACSADFNRDGMVNSQDFFDFLAAFFTGC